MLSPFADDRRLFKIIRAAQLAPSVLNTQPWSFWVRADDRIEVRATASNGRWLKVTDPTARELAISCGAALFNLRMAIRVTGHEIAAWLLPDPDDDPSLLASVEIVTSRVKPATAEEQELYDAIPRRHTYRWPFTGHRVHANILTEMALTAAKEKGWLRVLYPFQVSGWLHAAGEAERDFTRDPMYVAELRQWTSGAGGGLGVPPQAYGPQPPLTSMNPPVRDFGFDWGDGRPIERFESHPQLLSLATDEDRPLDWLRAGQALQRALLTATRYGVAASFLTQPLELADHQHQPRRWPTAWSYPEVPQMIIRVGYPGRRLPVTPREQAPEVVDCRSNPPRQVRPPDVDRAGRELSGGWSPRGRLPG